MTLVTYCRKMDLNKYMIFTAYFIFTYFYVMYFLTHLYYHLCFIISLYFHIYFSSWSSVFQIIIDFKSLVVM